MLVEAIAFFGALAAMAPGTGSSTRSRTDPPPPGGYEGEWIMPGAIWAESLFAVVVIGILFFDNFACLVRLRRCDVGDPETEGHSFHESFCN